MRYVALMFGLLMAMMACSAPSMAMPPSGFTTAYAAPEKAVLAVTATTATAAEHATASASEARTCSASAVISFNTAIHASPSVALGVDHSPGIAFRDPGDEDDGADAANKAGVLAASGDGAGQRMPLAS